MGKDSANEQAMNACFQIAGCSLSAASIRLLNSLRKRPDKLNMQKREVIANF